MGRTAFAVRVREPGLKEERTQRKAAIGEFVRRLKTSVRPTCIILFGSVARGKDTVRSDLDMVIIGGQLPEHIFDRLDVLARQKWGIPVSIDAFPYTETEFERMLDNCHVTALDAMYEGVPLHGKEYFNQLKRKFDALVKEGWRRTDYAWARLPEAV